MYESYELCGDKIFSIRLFRNRYIRLQDIHSWQEIYIGGGVPSIRIQSVDGRKADWDDEKKQLYNILRSTAQDQQMPFVTM